jgi:subtilisin family serine protease
MKYRVAGRIAAASVVAISFAALATPAHAEKIANSYICVFKPDRVAKAEVPGKANAAAKAHGGTVRHVYRNTIRGFSANMPEAAVTAMRRANPAIAYCEQDQVASAIGVAAKGKPGGGGTTPPAEQTPYGVTMVNGGGTGTFATAWVIDSGIDGAHPDLTVDTARSKDFTGSRSGWTDENGHGTHVSGTIAAKKNGIGVVGVAPGATLVAIRVLDRRGSGPYSDVIAGVDWVGAHGAPGDVANMSLGGPVSTALDDAVVAAASKGVRFTLAAGNESDDSESHSPARAEGANIFTVSAVDSSRRFASFSNYGSHVDWAEPGVSIYSTYKGQAYATLSGTSMAAPHLAGILLQGGVRSIGTATGDPDGKADQIGAH